MQRTTIWLLVTAMATAPLAGCLEILDGGGADDAGISLARVLTVDVGPEQMADDDVEPADLMTTAFEVVVIEGTWSVDELAVTYAPAEGVARAEPTPLSAFTSKTTLRSGDRVAIPDADISQPATLLRGAEVLSARTPQPFDSWTVNGVPVGFGADPGTTIEYALRAAQSASMTVAGVDVPEGRVERFMADSAWTADGTIGVDVPATARDGPFGSGFPADLSLAIDGEFPATIEVDGSFNRSALTGGLAIEDSSFGVDAGATIWVDGTGALQGGQSHEASFDADADVVMWFDAADPRLEQDVPCGGTTRADGCTPEFVEGVFPVHETEPAGEPEAIPNEPLSDDDEGAVAIWTAFLSQRLAIGDAVHFVVHGDTDALGAGPEMGSGSFEFRYDAEVTRRVDADVAAGTFDAHEVISTVTITAESTGLSIDGERLVEPFELAETIQRTTMWFDTDSQLLLRLEQTSPANSQRIVDTLTSAIQPPDESGVSRPDSVSVSADNRLEVELTELTGHAESSPLFAFALFQGTPLAAVGMLGPLGMATGYEEAVPEYPEGGTEAAAVQISAADSDGDGANDHIEAQLVRGENAPYDGFEVAIRGFTEDGQDLSSFTGDVCSGVPVEGGCAEGETFGGDGAEAWELGQTLYIPCLDATVHTVHVTIRSTPVAEGHVECDQTHREIVPVVIEWGEPTVDGYIPATVASGGPLEWVETFAMVTASSGEGNNVVLDAPGGDEWSYGEAWNTGVTKWLACAAPGPNVAQIAIQGRGSFDVEVDCAAAPPA